MNDPVFVDQNPNPFTFLARYQMYLGGLLVLAGIIIAVFPQVLVALIAGTIILAGLGLIGSGWRMRKLQHRNPTVSRIDIID